MVQREMVKHNEPGESDSDSGSVTIDREGQYAEELDEYDHEDGSDSEVDQDDDDDGGGTASDEDDEVHVREKITEVDPREGANFEQKLRAVMQESMEQCRQELRGRPTLNMMVPMNVFEGSAKDRVTSGESGDEALNEEAGGSREIQVKVVVKRGSKQQTKKMYSPQDCSLVQSTKQKEAAEIEEKQDIKRLVLENNDREEELNGFGTQMYNYPAGGNRLSS